MASSQAPGSKTLTMTLSRLDPTAKALMERLVLFDPDSIPLALFEPCHRDEKRYNGPDDEFPMLNECLTDKFPTRKLIDEAISTLSQYPLVTQHSEGSVIRCHSTVREDVLNSFDGESFSILFNQAIFALNAQFPKIQESPSIDNMGSWSIYRPHLTSLIHLYHRFAPSLRPPVLLCEIIRRCTWYLIGCGSFNEALTVTKKACEILELAVKNKNHPGYSSRYVDRLTTQLYLMNGTSEYELNLPGHGRSWYEKVQFPRKQVIDGIITERVDLKVMAIRNGNLSLAALAETGPTDSDIQPVDLAILSFKHIFDNFEQANSRGVWACNLSMAYRLKGMLEESWKWCEIANTWILKGEGAKSLHMATLHYCAGNTLLAQKNERKASIAFEQCLQTRYQKVPSHPFTGYTWHKVGLLKRAKGDLDVAIACLNRAIKIFDGCEGQAGAAIRSQFVLSSIFLEKGAFDDAESIKQEVIRDLEELGDPVTGEDLTEEYLDR